MLQLFWGWLGLHSLAQKVVVVIQQSSQSCRQRRGFHTHHAPAICGDAFHHLPSRAAGAADMLRLWLIYIALAGQSMVCLLGRSEVQAHTELTLLQVCHAAGRHFVKPAGPVHWVLTSSIVGHLQAQNG